MPSGWNVRETGAGVPITWAGRAWDMRMHWGSLNDDRRLRIRQGMEDIVPRIGSGGEVVGQITGHPDLLPKNGKDAFEEYGLNSVLVYARAFDEGGAGALAFTDVHYVQGEYLAAVVLFNSLQWGHPMMNTLAKFKTVAWHELGHVAGLLHCSSTTNVMNANLSKQLPWGDGDLDGFGVLRAWRFP